jgi:hypothetical protein
MIVIFIRIPAKNLCEDIVDPIRQCLCAWIGPLFDCRYIKGFQFVDGASQSGTSFRGITRGRRRRTFV